MPSTSYLNPDRIAFFERAGWQAYYDRNWLRAFWLLVQLNRSMFHMAWWTALIAALDTVAAARAFAPLDHNLDEVRRHLASFFDKARDSLDIAIDATTLAERELDYWVIHRDLAIRRARDSRDDNLDALILALTRLHVAIFGGDEGAMLLSGFLRSMATVVVDRITGGYSENVAVDWNDAEEYLRQAYRAVNTALQAQRTA